MVNTYNLVNPCIKGQFNSEIKAKNSVESTNFDKMKKIENSDGFVESVSSKKNNNEIPFFHLGPKNNWKNIFFKYFQKKLNVHFKDGLEELGYN